MKRKLIHFATRPFGVRRWIQLLFLTVVLVIGIKFYLFAAQIEAGRLPDIDRPPGVEAFLPISALVSVKHLALTKTINSVHPSGLVLFLIICLTALVAKKGFCSWVCPVGLLSEFFNWLHLKLFKKRLLPPRWLDGLLRGVKYFVAGFFLYQIVFRMSPAAVEQFIQSPYNRFADVKMLAFFTQISPLTGLVLAGLALLSIAVHNFWCRYLCPYGALLGVIGFFSACRIQSSPDRCTGCGRCEEKCPGQIAIRRKTRIHSPECSACMACVGACPEKGAIGFFFPFGKQPVAPSLVAVLLVFLFAGGITVARVSGNWHNDISKKAYLDHVQQKQGPWGELGPADPEKIQRMREMIRRMQQQKRLGEQQAPFPLEGQ